MITTMVFDHAARRHSYELMAEAFGLTPNADRPRCARPRSAQGVSLLHHVLGLMNDYPANPLFKQWRRESASTRFAARIINPFGWGTNLNTNCTRGSSATSWHCQTKRSLLGTVSTLGFAVVLAAGIAATPAAAKSRHQDNDKPKTKQVSKEPFGNIPTGPLQIFISINQQKLHLYSNGTTSPMRWSPPACPATRRRWACSASSRRTAITTPTSIAARRCPTCSASRGRAWPCTRAAA